MKFKIFLVLVLASNFIYAQPSEADIKSKLTSDVTLSIKFTKSTGTRQWNSSTGNWEYVRGVIITQKAKNFPEYKVIIGGDAVYQFIGGTKYSYWKFRPVYQYYEGIPNPTEAEIMKVLEKDWKTFYGYGFNKIINLHSQPQLAAEPGWMWHTPTSVSFKMRYTVDMITSNIHVETGNISSEVRFYRDEIKGEWKSFFVLNAPLEVTAKKEYSGDEIKQFQKNSLAFTLNEQQAKAAAKNLPDIAVPDFNTPEELADFIHSILLNGNPEQLKAVLIKTLDAHAFVPGSSVQLSPSGNNLIDNCIKAAYQSPLKYKDQYCANYKKGKLTSEQHIYIMGNLPKTVTLISMTKVNAGYINGVAKTKWKIYNLDVIVRQDEDAVNYFNSFSNKELLCAPHK